ncbi:sodium-independent sulfate anion transporter [Plutella xylostella]|uniref:sodium-independent sulfate anion transporter n=1 Tax=Plutella xylostella TaxID=51655 RepID=UPI0020324679|nr:sodium-independent sulfate anion transporter [Plutella xylostella]
MTVLHLAETTVRKRKSKCAQVCSVKSVKKRLPIVGWLPKYTFTTLIQDIIAGITVGLTAIPQGIAYAVVAGLSPEYGLYAGLMGGFVYMIFGSCKDVTVGPTAIMSAIVAKYVSSYSADFAVLSAFLSGVIILLMGIFQLGFVVEFISAPVISGFTTAAALQIASAQLKAIFGLTGAAGTYFAASIFNFTQNIGTLKLWDTVLGFTSIAFLMAMKKLGEGCKRTDGAGKQIRWFVSLARNAIVVIIGMLIAFAVKTITKGDEPLALIGEIGSGIPTFGIPPFTSVVGNETYSFPDMLKALGPESIVIPFVSILESVAIAKAFAGGVQVDATQEMIALGMCNIFGSFVRSMPITGSFTRTALNNASGVATTAGGIFTAALIILALSVLTSTFYFIPSASLAALIITAMFSMIDYTIFCRLWRCSKRELFVLFLTMAVSLGLGLEYGIVAGVLAEAAMLLFATARPSIKSVHVKSDTGRQSLMITLNDSLSYCSAEHVRREIFKATRISEALIVVDGTNLESMDTTVASNLMAVVKDLDKLSRRIVFVNFSPEIQKMCLVLHPNASDCFISAARTEDVIAKVSTTSPPLSKVLVD